MEDFTIELTEIAIDKILVEREIISAADNKICLVILKRVHQKPCYKMRSLPEYNEANRASLASPFPQFRLQLPPSVWQSQQRAELLGLYGI
jgi:hypothetical protein